MPTGSIHSKTSFWLAFRGDIFSHFFACCLSFPDVSFVQLLGRQVFGDKSCLLKPLIDKGREASLSQ